MIGVVGFYELLNGGSPSSNKSFYSYLMVFIEMLIQLFLENTKAKLILVEKGSYLVVLTFLGQQLT
jgi:hypothetical protein